VCSAWDPDYVPHAVAKDDEDEDDDDVTDNNENDEDWADERSSQSSTNKSIVEVPASKAKGKGRKLDCDGMPNRPLTITGNKLELTVDIAPVVKTVKRKRDQSPDSPHVLNEHAGSTGKRLRLAESRWITSGEVVPPFFDVNSQDMQ
jgi:hypothetical protein